MKGKNFIAFTKSRKNVEIVFKRDERSFGSGGIF